MLTRDCPGILDLTLVTRFGSRYHRDPILFSRSPEWVVQAMIEVAENTFVGEEELVFKTSRSSGPGGQNVNKLNTRVTLLFDVAGSPSLSQEQKQRIASRLSTRMDRQGVLRVVSQKHRSQEANRREAVERFQQLLRDALKPAPVRKKTKVPAGARQRRLKEKKQRGLLKRGRTGSDWGKDWS